MSEIVDLRWSEVDEGRSCLRLADSKTGAKVVPLGAQALRLILGQDRSGEFVCPGKEPAKPFQGLPKAWGRIRMRAELEDVRIHDLRHSFAAMAAGQGHSLLMIGAMLGHRSQQTTKRYAHLTDDPLRRATDRVASAVSAALDAGQPALRAVK